MKFPNIMQLLATTLLTVIANQSFAASGKDQLDAFYREVKSMQADFVQTVMSESARQVDETRGVLRMQRPGKFRWDYKQPYEQQIVADGEKLWVYDKDMDQVIVKQLDYALGNTPAVLLSGNVNLAEKFEISEYQPESQAEIDKHFAWVMLKPKQDDSGFQQLLLAFKNNDLQQMELIDSFGQMTRLTFNNLKRNPQIDVSVFKFTPPEGVDVISDVQ